MEKAFRDSPIWKHRPHVELRLAGAKRYKRLSWAAVISFAGGIALLLTGFRVDSAQVVGAGAAVAYFSLILASGWDKDYRLYDNSVRAADRELDRLANTIGIPVWVLAGNFWPKEIEEAGKQELCKMIGELLVFEEKTSLARASIRDPEIRDFWDQAVGNHSHDQAVEIFALYDLLSQFFSSVEEDGLNSYYALMDQRAKWVSA